jgi:hypothetical protein
VCLLPDIKFLGLSLARLKLNISISYSPKNGIFFGEYFYIRKTPTISDRCLTLLFHFALNLIEFLKDYFNLT